MTGQPVVGDMQDVLEMVSPDGLTVRAAHRRNPYSYAMSGEKLDALLVDVGLRRAASVWRNHTVDADRAPRGVYPRACMGFVIMDPTVPAWLTDTDAVLGVITVGDEGSSFLANAAAKAAGHRRLGRNYGEAVLVDPHLCGDGNFRYGHSAEVRGLIVGASSQSTDQDLYEAAALAGDLVAAIADAHRSWLEQAGPVVDWFAAADAPAEAYREMIDWFGAA